MNPIAVAVLGILGGLLLVALRRVTPMPDPP